MDAAERGLDLITMDTCCDSFLDEPLAKFMASLDDCLDPNELGQRPWNAFADILAKFDDRCHKVDRDRLPKGKVRRSNVFELAADRNVSIATVCVAAMAWGGMRVDHFGQLCKSSRGKWLEIAKTIRKGKLTRAEAYACLKKRREEGELKGMGPAFFTKLIYFLTPRDKPECQAAYIMDQWAASSVNLLTGSEIVRMNVTPSLDAAPKLRHKTPELSMNELALSFKFTVSDENTSDNYEAFLLGSQSARMSIPPLYGSGGSGAFRRRHNWSGILAAVRNPPSGQASDIDACPNKTTCAFSSQLATTLLSLSLRSFSRRRHVPVTGTNAHPEGAQGLARTSSRSSRYLDTSKNTASNQYISGVYRFGAGAV